MDSTFFLFFELAAFLIFFYSIERDSWQGLLVFLSFALFLSLSIASYDITYTNVFLNQTSGEIVKSTVSTYDVVISIINEGMALISLSIGIIKGLLYKTYMASVSEE
ncbi:hypothetical protein [Methanosarcina sp. Kolksee]|uniref:hypothetical protein n=1 Tax=Methanosarcina sp. Kolksee TaxID=1434099 RepID=UPI00064EC49C|nr:hypothetical protein [Methanosarcina sp. Kolksee]